MDLLQDIGRRFRELREENGLWVKTVAARVGVSMAMISKIEKGEYMPPHSVHRDMCRVLGTTFSEFMAVYRWTYTEPPKNESEVYSYVDYRKVS